MRWTLFIILMASCSASAEDQWFCKEGASRRVGDLLETCGIAKMKDEATARKKALEAAFEEFNSICEQSVDCRDYEKTVEPMRTECVEGKDKQYTCYRALDFTITHRKKQKDFKDQDKKEEIVTAISKNDGVNPLVNSTSGPPPDASPTIYGNVRYVARDPYVYVISSQPRVVYVRSQLPPEYVPPPPAPAPPHPRNVINRPNPLENAKRHSGWKKHVKKAQRHAG